MKRFGSALMILGAGVGAIVVGGMAGLFHLAFPWIVSLALAKLTLAGSLGLMAGGAVLRRIATRQETPVALGDPTPRTPV